eukprot:TRINITY_DN15669_c0_g1_i1.p1 TRINITY_DN15669_c0_g1~~TRINITY_DN15669_c0_g1_i1.p1  ORF type:complete len:1171 (+),score=361.55 TRINITY_DN15669_c0_g1_i1:96-3515(+)
MPMPPTGCSPATARSPPSPCTSPGSCSPQDGRAQQPRADSRRAERAASPRSPHAGGSASGQYFGALGRQPTPAEVQAAVRADPPNALAMIQEASGRECVHAWHTRRYRTQYVPIEVEREVPVLQYVDRVVPQPVPDANLEQKLRNAERELEQLRHQPPVMVRDEYRRRDKLSLKAQNERLLHRLRKKEENIGDLRLALHRNFAIAKELSDLGRPDLVEVRKEAERLLRGQVVQLQDTLRRKEAYIQEVTQALIDCSSYVLRVQREVQEVLRIESVEGAAAWEETRRLEDRARSLERELAVVPQLRAQLREATTLAGELRSQLDDKDDVIENLEGQFRQAQLDDGSALSRDEVLVRMTQLRFKIAMKNAAELKSKAEMLRLQERLRSALEETQRAQDESTELRAELDRLRANVDAAQLQMAELRRELLAAGAPVRPIVMPSAVEDDDARLLAAPAAPRTRPLSDQDIVAAFGLFDASAQGELAAWDVPIYLRALGFSSDDSTVRKLMAEYKHQRGTLTLEDFRDLLHALQRDYTPLRNSALSIIMQWQDASRRRVKAHKRRMQRESAAEADEDSDSDCETPWTSIAAISVRAQPLTPGDIETAFNLFDFDMSGELDRCDVGMFVKVLGLVRTEADLEALKVMVESEFSGTLNATEWGDVVQHCQGLQPSFVRRRVLEQKPPKRRIYPRAFPRAGRLQPLSERDVDTAFQLFNVDRSGLLPGHLIPTYLQCLGLVCSGQEFTALLITQYKVDLTQKVPTEYFQRIVRFVQSHLEFFNPSPRAPPVRGAADGALEVARRQPPILAPQQATSPPPEPGQRAVQAAGDDRAPVAPPQRPNTAVYSPRTRQPGTYPPWMTPGLVPATVDAADAPAQRADQPQRTAAAISAAAQGGGQQVPGARLSMTSAASDGSGLDSGDPADAAGDEDRVEAVQAPDALKVFKFFTGLFKISQVAVATGPAALALQHVTRACRALGFRTATKRFLEQIWPYERKMDAAQRQGGGSGDELILDENEFVRLVRNIERYGLPRTAGPPQLPKQFNRVLSGGALRDQDIREVFELIDDDRKHFLFDKEFRDLLTLIGFTLHDEPDIQNVLVAYDRRRPSRTSREHKIYELHDCVEVVRQLTAKSQVHSRGEISAASFI